MTGLASPDEFLDASLLGLCRAPRPWGEVEAALTKGGRPGAQLGGDPLRPYVVQATLERVTVAAVRRAQLPDPPLIAELLAGRYGPPVLEHAGVDRGGVPGSDAEVVRMEVSASPALSARLALPDVLLVGLGDRDRYRGARLPLGVARLASWLRFTHAARVEVLDYSLQSDARSHVTEALGWRPAVVGVGVNFGQWELLADLAGLIEQATASSETSPVVVLGNILAAFSPTEAVAPFKRAAAERRALVATGLGERPLEALCRSLHTPKAWETIPGLLQPEPTADGGDTSRMNNARRVRHQPVSTLARRTKTGVVSEAAPRVDSDTLPSAPLAPSLVAPDDSLVLAVAAEGGQVSLETSLGCQYGACTFCPRAHKGDGWLRGEQAVCVAILERFSRLRTSEGSRVAVSLVDEEFFGSEGLADPPPNQLGSAHILAAMERLGLRCEIYTRLEQLFDRHRSRRWNLRRAMLLAETAPSMRRLFAGVESGSPSQLRRYGKGQTVSQTVDALRVASTLGVPLEFGFITFDPLLTPEELVENLAFLARTDVICAPYPDGPSAAVAQIGHYLNGADLPGSGDPLYRHVAYMATELEVLANSRYADHLHRRHPELLDGYDPAFCRFGAHYAHGGIETIAGWCRVWTEGMFTPVYQARMAARSAGTGEAAEAKALVRRYRDATFALLVTLTDRFLPGLNLPQGFALAKAPSDEPALLTAESLKVTGHPITFDPSLLERRRDR